MQIIEITEDKFEKLTEKTGKALRYLGEVMSCLDEMQREGGQMGERRSYDYRDGRYGMRHGGYEPDMGERGGYPRYPRY